MRNKKTLVFITLAIGTLLLMQVRLYPEKPAFDFWKNVVLMIAFFAFLNSAFKPEDKYSITNLLKTKPIILIGILATLTLIGVVLQVMLFW